MRIRLQIDDWSGEEGIPQGLKALSSSFVGSPRLKPWAYLEAKANYHVEWDG
jgi:hypothetical protein